MTLVYIYLQNKDPAHGDTSSQRTGSFSAMKALTPALVTVGLIVFVTID